MKLVVENQNPSIVRLIDFQDNLDSVKTSLTYTDKAAVFQYQKFKKATYLLNRMGPEKFSEQLEELKIAQKKCLLFEDDNGFYTYAGLAPYLSAKIHVPVVNLVNYPESKALPYANLPEYEPYPYQSDSKELLVEARHGGVEIGTGLGKNQDNSDAYPSLRLKNNRNDPATAISEQVYEGLVKLFGKKYVGKYFEGKKEANKLIVVANAQSLTRVNSEHPDWDVLSSCKVFIADESHQCPASTLESVCFGLAAPAPYRFFFSATQLRNDGKDLLLEGITGKIVYTKTVYEGVKEKYLSKPVFRFCEVTSDNPFSSKDANEMTRAHLYYNDKAVEEIGKFVNHAVNQGFPVVVLIEEVEQFTKLLPLLRHEVRFAHGTLNKENKPKVPSQYWESDPTELVKQFNNLEYPILVGTSCITTGVDIKAVKALVYWQGGKSEIQVKQAIGRATRLFPGKTFCVVFDIDVVNQDTLKRHTEARRKIYAELYPDVKNSMTYIFDEGFKNFAQVLETRLSEVPVYNEDELIRHQRAQIRKLVNLETKFRETLIDHRSGPNVYDEFVNMICVEKGNILSARPYFRERQETFTKYISKALKEKASAGLYSFKINWTFIQWVLSSRKWRNGPIQKIAQQIFEIRKELLEQNLPLAISQARGFYASTPRSHLNFMDIVQIQAQGLLLAIDKFCPPDDRKMTETESLEAYRGFRAVAIGIMRRDRVNDYSQTLMHFYPRDRQKIYWANKMLRRFVDEVDHEIIAQEINNNVEDNNDKTDAEEIADLLATATTVSADYAAEPDGETVVDLAIGDESLRPDLKVEANNLQIRLLSAIDSTLTVTEQKLLKLRGVK